MSEQIKSDKCNLNGSVLTLSVNQNLPYCDLQFEDNKIVVNQKSIEIEMINVLAKKYNFVYHIIYANQNWGNFENGMWTGSIGHLNNKSADIAICELTMSWMRSQVVDFTRAYYLVPLTYVTRRPGLKSRKWITIKPYSIEVWISILFSVIFATTFLQLLYRKCIKVDKRRVDSISISLIGSLLQQSDVKLPLIYGPIRFFAGIWFLMTMILLQTYSGVFYSVLTVPEYKEPLNSLEDLAKAADSGDYSMITFPNSFLYSLFFNAKCCDLTYKIGQNMKQSSVEFPVNSEQAIVLINDSNDKKMIFVNSYVSISFGVRSMANVPMHISTESLMMDHLAMGLQKGSPLLKSMDTAIEQFIEIGLYKHWMRTMLELKPAMLKEEHHCHSETIRNIHLNDLDSVFFIFILGLSISIGMFLIEKLILYNISRIQSRFLSFRARISLRGTKIIETNGTDMNLLVIDQD